MRLQFFFSSPVRGGCENYAVTIGRAAVSVGWELCGAFPQRSATRSVVEDVEAVRGQYHALEISEDGGVEGQAFQRHDERRLLSLEALKATRPDVCLLAVPSIQYMSGTMVACAELGIPTVVCFQYVQRVFEFVDWRLDWYARARKSGQRWVAVSDNNRQILAKSFHMAPDDIQVIYNGSDTRSSTMTPDETRAARASLRGALGLDEDTVIMLTVSALRSQKGHDVLIEAIPQVLKEFPHVHWLWAGDGPDAEKLRGQLRERGIEEAVHMLGRRDDVWTLLQTADYFVFPTRFEGHPFALMEALSAGLPVVTTDASGISESVTHLEHAVVCPKEDPTALAEGMLFALRNPERMKQMSAAGRERVKDFSEEKMVKQTMELLEHVGGRVGE